MFDKFIAVILTYNALDAAFRYGWVTALGWLTALALLGRSVEAEKKAIYKFVQSGAR